VYQNFGIEIMARMKREKPSVKSARLGMVGELVEFLENSFPELINTMIGLLGVIVLIGAMNLSIFYGCLLVTLIVFLIYWMSSDQTSKLNESSNDEMEKQVDIISAKDEVSLGFHLKNMMKWNIKLSDLEAVNFSLSWIVLLVFLVGSIMISIQDEVLKYGTLFSLLMYVFQYLENVMNLPFFYQEWLRLKEIEKRLEMN